MLFGVQILLILLSAFLSSQHFGPDAFLPAMYGGCIALANTMLLSQKVKKAGEAAKYDPKKSVSILYVGMIQRIAFVLVGLGIGLGALKFLPLPLLGTFMVAQLAYVFAGSQKINV